MFNVYEKQVRIKMVQHRAQLLGPQFLWQLPSRHFPSILKISVY
jgi:hypothetical protein